MRRFRAWLIRLGGMFGESWQERDLADELESHLEMHTEENIRRGMSREEARRQALLQLGGLEQTKERIRERRTLPILESFFQDVRYGLRQLRRNPGFTAVAVVTLALGIGANTAIFSAVRALLLDPYPFPDSDRIMFVEARHVSGNNSSTGYRDFLDWREQNTVFEQMAIFPSAVTYTWTGKGEPQRIVGGITTFGFLRVLRVRPVLGRFFTAEEDRPGAPRLAVLSYAAWQERFGGSPDVLGRTITLNEEPFTIIGVLPNGFALPGAKTCEFFTALRESPSRDRYQHQYHVLARLKPGVTRESARANMTVIAKRLEHEFPATNSGWGVEVAPIREALAELVRKPVLILFSAVLLGLMIACANIAGLQLARSMARTKEIAVRASIGATRGRIVRQMLTESLLIGLAGGGLGLVVAAWLMDVIRAAAPEDLALDASLRINPVVLMFTVGLSVVTGLVFGAAPALCGSKTDLNAALKGDANAWSGGRARNRFLSSLIVGEAALSMVLLVGAGLLVKDLLFVLHVDTGLRIEHVLTFTIDPPQSKYSSPGRTVALYQELLSRLKAAPGVDAAAAVATLPMTGAYSGGAFEIEGRPKPADWMDINAQYNVSTPGFFRVMGIPLLSGRDFEARDTANSLPVAIVNDTLARQYFPNQNPIGHRIKWDDKWQTIVGVMGSFKHQQPMRPAVPMIYTPFAQSPDRVMWVAVRTTADPSKLVGTARGIVRDLDRDTPVLKLRTMRQVVADSLSQPRLMTWLLASFAAFALALAAIGIYGINAYSVAHRWHEMGIRMALGASYGDVLGLVLRNGAGLAGIGIGLGIPAALAVSQVMGSLLYGISPRDLAVFAGVPLLLQAVALAASYLPARRAARVDPVVALRYE